MTDATLPLPEEVELVPGTPEYDKAMAEKFETSQATPPQEGQAEGEQRPGWLPEKFKTPEDMAKAYQELEKKLGANTQQQPTEAPQQTEARETVEAAGLDFDALSAKFMDQGGLEDADYEALAKAGIPREMVDAYVEGQRALGDKRVAEVYDAVGGADAYAELTGWAGENLPASEIEAFNKVVDTGDLNAIKLAISGLKARYEATNGTEPKLLNATTGTQTAEAFRSHAELTAAMRDPRYKVDPAYRADVQRKLANSDIF